jgi:hypothetical protein
VLLGLVCLLLAGPTRAAPASADVFPIRAACARLSPGTLEITVPWSGPRAAGRLRLRLTTLLGRELARADLTVAEQRGTTGPLVLRLKVPEATRIDLDLHRLEFDWTGPGAGAAGGPAAARGVLALSEILEVPLVSLRGQTELVAGSRAAVTVVVTDPRGHGLPGVPVRLTVAAAGRRLERVARTGAAGETAVPVDLPRDWAGRAATLEVRAEHSGLQRTVKESLTVSAQVRARLTVDKPIHQPGQQVHARLVVLHHPSREPVARARVVLDLADPRGTRLAQVELRTDAFGVGWAVVPLAATLSGGRYRLRAAIRPPGGSAITETLPLVVHTYRLPGFRVGVSFDQRHYLPGGHLAATVEATYLFGKPVPDGRVEVAVRLVDRAFRAEARQRGRRKVWDYDGRDVLVERHQGRTDRAGRYRLVLTVPRGFSARHLTQLRSAVRLDVSVVDATGQAQRHRAEAPVAPADILVFAHPQGGQLGPGVPQTVWLVASRPDGTPAARTRLAGAVRTGDAVGHAAPGEPFAVTTDAHGVAHLVVTPRGRQVHLGLTALDPAGRRGQASLDLEVATPRLAITPARSIVVPGTTLPVRVLGAPAQGTVHLQLRQGDQTVAAGVAPVVDGEARFALPVPPAVDGVLVLLARTEAGGVADGRALVVAPAARRLDVSITSARDPYAPGEDVDLRLSVTDETGQGREAAIGLTVVDEAAYAYAGKAPDVSATGLLLGRRLGAIDRTINGWSLARLLGAPASDDRQALSAALLASLVDALEIPGDSLVKRGEEDLPAYRLTIHRRLTARLAARARATFLAFAAAQHASWRKAHRAEPLCVGEWIETSTLVALVAAGWLRPGDVLDPWGRPWTWTSTNGCDARDVHRMTLHSVGIDGVEGTEDDLTFGPYRLFPPDLPRRRGCLVGWGCGGSGGYGSGSGRAVVFMSRASRSVALGPGAALPAAPEVRVRRDFRETLAALPSLRTDARGQLRVPLRMADNLTTWVVSAFASDRTGRLGGKIAHLRVFQRFLVDAQLPPSLTRLDEITVPVAVHNYTGQAAEVRVRLEPAPWFQALTRPETRHVLLTGPGGPRLQPEQVTPGALERTAVVQAQGVETVRFRLRLVATGVGRLTVKAWAPGFSDGVQRSVNVLPEGEPVERSGSGVLRRALAFAAELPGEAAPGSGHLWVRLQAGLVATTLQGLEGLLRRPYGCFEQTSATTYPNLLVLRHLRARPVKPAVLAQARRLVAEGYQRLAGYEVPGGGFSLFGHAPADLTLTAFGLLEFHDLARVSYVDPRLIPRTAAWVARRQAKDGSFAPDRSLFESSALRPASRIAVTAYVATALARTGHARAAVDAALGFLAGRVDALRDDPYLVALVAQAFTTAARRDRTALLAGLRRRLAAAARRDREGRVHWAPRAAQKTLFWGTGATAAVELTALAAQVLAESDAHGDLVQGARLFLLAARKSDGAWGTTAATVQALVALLGQRAAGDRGPRWVDVRLDGRLAARVKVVADGPSERVDLGAGLAPGRHRVELATAARGVDYQWGFGYHRPVGALPVEAQPPSTRLGLEVAWGRRPARVGDLARLDVTLTARGEASLDAPVAEIGLPPGLDLQLGDLDRLVDQRTIDRYEVRPRGLVLYFTRLPPGQRRLSLHLRASAAEHVTMPGSTFYEYYQPEGAVRTAAQRLLIAD